MTDKESAPVAEALAALAKGAASGQDTQTQKRKRALLRFLLARIAEDEQRLALPDFIEEDSARGPGWGNRGQCPVCDAYQFSGREATTEEAWWDHDGAVHQRRRTLAECEAKRRIIELAADAAEQERRANQLFGARMMITPLDEKILNALVLPYAGPPDYDPEWRP